MAEHGANVVDVEHLRDGIDLHVRETAIQLVLQTAARSTGARSSRPCAAEGFAVAVERAG